MGDGAAPRAGTAAAIPASNAPERSGLVGYSLGLAASVRWLGALGDRYGRKRRRPS
jgi:MFS family permease